MISNNSKISKDTRYRNLEDLQFVMGSKTLDSYIVPELHEISDTMRRKKI